MEIITIQCPKCHGSLHVEQGAEKMFCMYCRAEVVVRETKKNDFATSDSLIKRGFLLVEHRDWEKALEVFDQAANIDPENAQIYLGMLLVQTKITSEELLKKHTKSLSSYTSYKKAVRFADHELRKSLETYNEITVKSEKVRKEKKKQQEVAESRRIAQIEKEVAKRTGLFHWGISTLKSFVYSILIFEIAFLSVNGKFGLVTLDLFRNWDRYNDPSSAIKVFFAFWILFLFIVASERKKKMRVSLENELSGRE